MVSLHLVLVNNNAAVSLYLNDVSVVELILEVYDFPHEPDGTELEESVAGFYQDQYPPEEIWKRFG